MGRQPENDVREWELLGMIICKYNVGREKNGQREKGIGNEEIHSIYSLGTLANSPYKILHER